MALERSKAFERSVDGFSRIYAVVIGLSLSESVKTLVAKTQSGEPIFTSGSLLSGAPAFVALIFTLVPFWHGMNRHLDNCYLEKEGEIAQGALIFDFATFFAEGSLLLLAAWSLRVGLVTFYCLGALLAIDTVWGFISHQIHFPGKKSHVVRWAVVNFSFGCLAVLVVAYRFDAKAEVLMLVAIARSVVDYWRCWSFYFPSRTAPVPPERL